LDGFFLYCLYAPHDYPPSGKITSFDSLVTEDNQDPVIQKLLILLALFMIALVAGYFFAQIFGIIPPPSIESLPTNQVRYLVMRVDDLNKPNPSLLTIWGAIVSFSSPTTIYFSPVFPTQSNPADLSALFRLDQDRVVSSEFLEALKKYNLDLTGYIIVDSVGSDSYLNWLIPAKNRVVSTPPVSTKGVQTLLNQQRQYYLQVCQTLSQPSKINPFSLNWKAVYPDHLIPTPNIETIMTTFHRLFSDSQSIKCYVVD